MIQIVINSNVGEHRLRQSDERLAALMAERYLRRALAAGNVCICEVSGDRHTDPQAIARVSYYVANVEAEIVSDMLRNKYIGVKDFESKV